MGVTVRHVSDWVYYVVCGTCGEEYGGPDEIASYVRVVELGDDHAVFRCIDCISKGSSSTEEE